ncbi:arylsulfatase B [Neodiprion pinetum]|uniref:arylsulfatase B n=1 Tax=Neodiprion pinetum TaxID=441929 RepID=UPI001EE09807|nr:arylsulfatase B-like [Neodiprion pinetum]
MKCPRSKTVCALIGLLSVISCADSCSGKINTMCEKSNEDSPRSDQPHIITIIADDLGWNDVSFHGHDQIPTPNIDALAANGVILNRYYVQPTCTPSRTAFLTGRYPLRAGMQGIPLTTGERWGIPVDIPLFPGHLRNLGYTTRLLGKWHLGYYTVDHVPTQRGFDSFVGYYNGYIKYFDHTIRQDETNETGYDLHRDDRQKLTIERNKDYFTDFLTEEVEDVIKSHDVSKPLYLQIAHLAPHSGEPEEPLEVWNVTEVNLTLGYIKDINRRKFAGMVTRLDNSVGRTIKALKNAGMLENSIVIFTTDNGAQTEGLHVNYGSNYPLRGLKFSMFDGGVRGVGCIYSPLIVNSSRVSNELMHITDWMPTLYSAAGGDVKVLGELDGVDQWPTLKYGLKSPRTSLLLHVDEKFKVAGAVMGKFKFLQGNQINYTDFYGDIGDGDNYPPYSAASVVSSAAGQAISQISESVATPQQIISLRLKTKISCPPFQEYVNCTSRCLFDLSVDPCETVNLSEQHPKIVELMESYIEKYQDVLVQQSSGLYDRTSSPAKFNGAWMPWIKFNHNDESASLLEVPQTSSAGDIIMNLRSIRQL